jgi:single-stranded DNA-specific DHH superfamily exonuclease
MLKKAAEFLKEIDNKKTLIIFDTDGDGIGSAAILAKTMKRIFKRMPEAMPANHGLSFIDSSMVKKIKSKKFDAIITVDAAVDEKPEYVLELAKKSRILIIDHHQIHRNLNNSKILHVNPNLWKTKFVSYKYCTSKIVYDICSKLTNIEDLDWLAGIGIVNDKSEDTWKGFLKGVYKKYKISSPKLRLTNDIITSGYCYSGRKGVMTGYRACLETSSPVDILRAKTNNTRRLKKFYDIIEGEIVSEMKNWKRNAEIIEDKKLIILKLNTKFSISSPISTKISFEKPHYTVLVIRKNGKVFYMSLRRQDKEVDCGRIAEKVIKNLKDASGGGHIPAAGIHIMSKDWKIFRKRVLELL